MSIYGAPLIAINNTTEVETAVAAYNCNFTKFLQHCHQAHMSRHRLVYACICRGCAFSYEFAKSFLLFKGKLYCFFNDNIKRAICASFVMNNDVDIELINETKPFCIWYPQVPSLETCELIKKKTNKIDYSLAILCILMNWYEVFATLDIKAENTLLTLCVSTKRTKFFDFLISKVQDNKVYNFIDFENEIINLDESKFDSEFKPKDIDLFSYHTKYKGNGDTRQTFCVQKVDLLHPRYFPLEYKYPGGYGALTGMTFEYFAVTKDLPMYRMDYELANRIMEDEQQEEWEKGQDLARAA